MKNAQNGCSGFVTEPLLMEFLISLRHVLKQERYETFPNFEYLDKLFKTKYSYINFKKEMDFHPVYC